MTTLNRMDVATVVTDVLKVNTSINLPSGGITNTMVKASAGVNASKLEGWEKAMYAQAGTAATETIILAIIRGSTGTSVGVEVGNVTANAGASTVTVDVKKNGTSILSAVITLNAATGDAGVETGTVTTTTLADGDVITAVITAVQNGTDALATGVAVQFDYNEDHPSA